jgi:hypothetical protein
VQSLRHIEVLRRPALRVFIKVEGVELEISEKNTKDQGKKWHQNGGEKYLCQSSVQQRLQEKRDYNSAELQAAKQERQCVSYLCACGEELLSDESGGATDHLNDPRLRGPVETLIGVVVEDRLHLHTNMNTGNENTKNTHKERERRT